MPNGRGMRRGWRRGGGRGRCWGPLPWAWGMPAWGPAVEPTEEDLKAEIEALKEDKEDVDAEIAEIEKMLEEKRSK